MTDDADALAAARKGNDYERLHRDYLDATRQFAATNEILAALGRSDADSDAVLSTIVERAAELCRAQVSQIYLANGDELRLSKMFGPVLTEYVDYVSMHPLQISRDSIVGRAAVDRQTQQIFDVLADPDYGRQDLQRTAGYRTVMSAPMLVNDEVVGVLGVWRTQVEPFDDRATDASRRQGGRGRDRPAPSPSTRERCSSSWVRTPVVIREATTQPPAAILSGLADNRTQSLSHIGRCQPSPLRPIKPCCEKVRVSNFLSSTKTPCHRTSADSREA